MNPKHPLKDAKKSGVMHRINCAECSSYYFGKKSKRLIIIIYEHRSAVRRHDNTLHTLAHTPETEQVLDFKKTKVQAQGKSKRSRLIQEAWHSSRNASNRSIELHLSTITSQQENPTLWNPGAGDDNQIKSWTS